MKKLVQTFVMMALVLSLMIVPVMADDSTTESDVSDEETAPFVSLHGTEMRFLQLEKALTKNILLGERVINHLGGNQELELIVEELKDLKAEVRVAIDELTGDPETDAQTFHELKRSAVELTKEFHMLARELLSEEDREELRKEEIDRTEIDEINERIKAARDAHNADRLARVFDRLGIDNPELLDKVADGDASPNEVRDAIKDGVQELSPEEKRAAAKRIKEHQAKNRIAKRVVVDRVKDNIQDRMETRRELWNANKDERIADWKDNFEERKADQIRKDSLRKEFVKQSVVNRIEVRQDAFNSRIDAKQVQVLDKRPALTTTAAGDTQ